MDITWEHVRDANFLVSKPETLGLGTSNLCFKENLF